jgi:uncharacterized protein YfbU (UPF0304 family)
MPIKTISDYLYRVRIHFIYGETLDIALKAFSRKSKNLKKDWFTDSFNHSAGFVAWAAEQDIFLILPEYPATVETTIHEAFHLVDNIFRRKGLALSEESAEAYAYYLGWITQKLANFLHYVEKIKKLENKVTKLKKRYKTMKSKSPKSAIKKAINQFAKKDKKDDMKMIKAAIKKSKRK